MGVTTRLYTATDLADMPGDEPWELWEGELQKVPGAGGTASGIAHRIGVRISLFVEPRDLGWVTGADGTYIILDDPQTVVVPDLSFVRWERLPGRAVPDGYIPLPPDLAVEVVSPSDEPGDIARKQELYRRAGIPLVWWVYPSRRAVAVVRHGQREPERGVGDRLDGGDVLPEFHLPIADIFAGF